MPSAPQETFSTTTIGIKPKLRGKVLTHLVRESFEFCLERHYPLSSFVVIVVLLGKLLRLTVVRQVVIHQKLEQPYVLGIGKVRCIR